MTEQRILVVSPSWVGDMVISQTLYSLLKKRNPNVQIDVMAPGASKPLLSRMAHVHQSVLFDVSHGEVRFGYRARFAKSLRSNQYDQAIVLPNSLKSALVPFLANIPVRTGYRGEMRYILLNDIRRLDKARLPRMIDRFMSLGLAPGGPLPEYKPPELIIDQGNQEDCLRRFGLDRSSPTLGICPGAEFGDAKRWPEEKFAEVAQGDIDAGMQVWLFVSAADRPMCPSPSLTGPRPVAASAGPQPPVPEAAPAVPSSQAGAAARAAFRSCRPRTQSSTTCRTAKPLPAGRRCPGTDGSSLRPASSAYAVPNARCELLSGGAT